MDTSYFVLNDMLNSFMGKIEELCAMDIDSVFLRKIFSIMKSYFQQVLVRK